MPILVMKDNRTKRLAASFVLNKGNNTYARKIFTNFILSTGYRKIINTSDGVPAMVSLKMAAIKDTAHIAAIPQEPPVGDHQANGEIEQLKTSSD